MIRWTGFSGSLLLVLLMALLTGWACKHASPPQPSPEAIRYLALGDSYTIGISVAAADRWPNQLSDSLRVAGKNVTETSFIAQNGWRTNNLYYAIRAENPGSDWDLVSLLIGVNDFFQGISVVQYDSLFPILLDTAIELAGGRPERVFVVSIPDYAFTPYGQGTPDPSSISVGLDTFNAHAERWCMDRGVLWVPITDISRRGLDQSDLVANDGLHPSGIQYGAWVSERLLGSVEALLP